MKIVMVCDVDVPSFRSFKVDPEDVLESRLLEAMFRTESFSAQVRI